MDTVLGLLVTPTNVQTVLVEGQSGDGATLEHDEFVTRASEEVAEAVLSIAETEGQRLHSIGVTWSDDADLEASQLLDSLAGLGLHNIVLVKLPQAAEALACSIGRVIGYERTAVCVVEPDAVMLSLVDTYDGEVETLVSHTLISEDTLVDWVTAIFDRDDWRPEGLFVVGSVGGLKAVATRLEQALALPVFDPPEAELALAHGAALASVSSADSAALFGDGDEDHWDYVPPAARIKRKSYAGPMTMLVAGAVTFVVSVSLALGPHLVPEKSIPIESREVMQTAGTPPIAAPIVPEAPPVVPVADAPPPPAAVDPAPVDALPPAPEPEATYAPEPEAPAYVPDEPAAVAPVDVPPPAYVPPPAPQVVAPPQPQTPVRSWLKEKLHLGN
ncbi:hypothetical protein BH09ACT8_BH09ACT8_24680 [soil metagenome]